MKCYNNYNINDILNVDDYMDSFINDYISSFNFDSHISCKICNMKYKLTKTFDNICIHCHFKSNYHVSKRKKIDGKYGIKIVDYILQYHSNHKPNDNCNNCFLCDYNNDIYIVDIKDYWKIYDVIKENMKYSNSIEI